MSLTSVLSLSLVWGRPVATELEAEPALRFLARSLFVQWYREGCHRSVACLVSVRTWLQRAQGDGRADLCSSLPSSLALPRSACLATLYQPRRLVFFSRRPDSRLRRSRLIRT